MQIDAPDHEVAPCAGAGVESLASKPDLKVVTLHATNFRDVAGTLRQLADDIEAGRYGDVESCGVVIHGDGLNMFGAGPNSEAPTIALLFHEGFMRLKGDFGH